MRPFQHLPIKFPSEFDPSEAEPDFFYKNFIKPMIPDMIKMTDVGLFMDQDAVEDLRVVVEEILVTVTSRLESNPITQQYKEYVHPILFAEFKADIEASKRSVDHYIKEYRPKDMVHRTYVVNNYFKSLGKDNLIQDKWTVKDLKSTNIFVESPFIKQVVQGTVSSSNKFILEGMLDLANEKVRLWNIPRDLKIANGIEVPEFNPSSAKQKQTLFSMLGIRSPIQSKKTGDDSWGRDQVEELLETSTDKDLVDLLEAFVDHSYGAIIKNNFLAAFDSFTVDGVLRGNIKLFGTKGYRPSSNNPNLLNMPSTKSIYAKPLKKCFVAPDGYLAYTVDLAALEDRVLANLSGDENKLGVFLEGLDGHSMGACFYDPIRAESIVGKTVSIKEAAKKLKQMVDDGDTEADEFRTWSKNKTFKLAYGGFPDVDKGGSITQEIFDAYHNDMYKGVSEYTNTYVLKTVKEQGYIHLGLGCRMYTDDPDKNIRTLHNATCQFWSILVLITINELNYLINKESYSEDIKVNATIYDSIYLIVKEDPAAIKWLNDTIINLLTVNMFESELVHNEAVGKLGKNWCDLYTVKNNSSIDEIKTVMEKINE